MKKPDSRFWPGAMPAPLHTAWFAAIASLLLLVLGIAGLGSESGMLQKIGRLITYVAPLPLVLALSQLFPAQAGQRSFSPHLLQDMIYFAVMIVFRIVFTSIIIVALHEVYTQHLGMLTLRVGDSWPATLRVLVALLIGDFLAWFHHLVRHRVPAFWHFHAVHHSQREMNYFTDFRIHFVDYLIAQMIVILPMFMLKVDAPTIIVVSLLIQWHTMIYHANLHTNYGPLRYVFVTPQSHRVHHSRQYGHYDSNFGVIFSIWDRLFGTQHPDDRSYPPTGVDPEFPVERSYKDVVMLKAFSEQFLAPFRRLFQRVGA